MTIPYEIGAIAAESYFGTKTAIARGTETGLRRIAANPQLGAPRGLDQAVLADTRLRALDMGRASGNPVSWRPSDNIPYAEGPAPLKSLGEVAGARYRALGEKRTAQGRLESMLGRVPPGVMP